MSTLDGHKVNDLNKSLYVYALDKDDLNVPCCEYYITTQPLDGDLHEFMARISEGNYAADIEFHSGPVENGVVGLTNEVLLEIVKDRLRRFQAGEFACVENEYAIEALQMAINRLHKRTLRLTAK
jgi:hypothetical protein